MPGAMTLGPVQRGIQEIYELNVAYNVDDFLVTGEAAADPGVRPVREKLLVQEESGDLNLSLFLDTSVLENLRRNDPLVAVGPGNIEDFCLALEGISHFLYVIWNASHERSVTLLEMELQAEIDKFVMLSLCMARQQNAQPPGALIRLLFRSARFHGSLSPGEARRYRDASGYAARYCERLERGFIRRGKERGMLRELRRFYRLRQQAKLNHIGDVH